jgi:hypothetical protein
MAGEAPSAQQTLLGCRYTVKGKLSGKVSCEVDNTAQQDTPLALYSEE